MRLVLAILALAAALLWSAWRLDALTLPDTAAGETADVVAARRLARPALRTAATPPTTTPAPTPGAAVPGTGPATPQTPMAPQAPPLFRLARNPAPPPPPAAPRAGENFTLVGVIGQGQIQVGLLRDTVDSHIWRVIPGARMGAWTVDNVETACVAFHRGRERRRLCL